MPRVPNAPPGVEFTYDRDEWTLTLTFPTKKYVYREMSPYQSELWLRKVKANFGKGMNWITKMFPWDRLESAGTSRTEKDKPGTIGHLRGKPYVRITFMPAGKKRKRTAWAVKVRETPRLATYRIYTKDGEMTDELVIGPPDKMGELPAVMNLHYGEFELKE